MSIGELSVVFSVGGALPYVYHIVHGKVRPERATWFIWTVLLVFALLGYRAAGAHDSLWFLVGDLFVTALIFILSLWRGVGGLTKLDLACLAIAAVGVLCWQLSDAPLVALLGSVVADTVAMVPTLVKALRDPFSENSVSYACTSVAAALSAVAVGQWSFVLLLYPVYLFLASFSTALVVWVGQYQLKRLGSVEARTFPAE